MSRTVARIFVPGMPARNDQAMVRSRSMMIGLSPFMITMTTMKKQRIIRIPARNSMVASSSFCYLFPELQHSEPVVDWKNVL